ncbi:DUF3781 domain-containing protein [Lactococcus petauri]
MKNTENTILFNLDKIHTTEMGFERLKKNLQLQTEDIICWCKKQIANKKSVIIRKGKNWYVTIKNIVITVNAHSYTIITAHIYKHKE